MLTAAAKPLPTRTPRCTGWRRQSLPGIDVLLGIWCADMAGVKLNDQLLSVPVFMVRQNAARAAADQPHDESMELQWPTPAERGQEVCRSSALLIRIMFRSNWAQETNKYCLICCVYYLHLDFDFTIPSRKVETWQLRLHSFFFRVEK